MMIIDLDNFKQINDSYGHMFGDAVLTKFPHSFQRLFRTGDVIVRIGGDEFLVYMCSFAVTRFCTHAPRESLTRSTMY